MAGAAGVAGTAGVAAGAGAAAAGAQAFLHEGFALVPFEGFGFGIGIAGAHFGLLRGFCSRGIGGMCGAQRQRKTQSQ